MTKRKDFASESLPRKGVAKWKGSSQHRTQPVKKFKSTGSLSAVRPLGKSTHLEKKRKASSARGQPRKRNRRHHATHTEDTTDDHDEVSSDTTSHSNDTSDGDMTDVTDKPYIAKVDEALLAVAENIKQQFSFLYSIEETEETPEAEQTGELNDTVEGILDALDMKKYYPQKLRYEDLITLTSDDLDDVSKKPTSLPELPWYFMKQVIGLNSDVRESCHLEVQDDGSDDTKGMTSSWFPRGRSLSDISTFVISSLAGIHSRMTGSGESSYDVIDTIHPLDLIYIIFLCADDFLRQQLVDKMVMCQYAVPFILPSPETEEQKSTILQWALRGVVRTFNEGKKIQTSSLVDLESPLVSFVSFGEEPSWKTKLLNNMLSPQQETFWHEELQGGDLQQKISTEMVEIAWYLPGENTDNKFPFPVTFASTRGHSLRRELCDWSTAFCVFANEVNDELRRFLESSSSTSNLLLVLLYKKDEEKKTLQQVRELTSTFRLGSKQVICKPKLESNFNTICQQVKKSISYIVSSSNTKRSLTALTAEVQESRKFQSDDVRGRNARAAADEILRDVESCSQSDPMAAKMEILRAQADLQTRRQIGYYEKELCRQTRLKGNDTIQKVCLPDEGEEMGAATETTTGSDV